MSTSLAETNDAGRLAESLQLELERCRLALEESRGRLGELEQAESLLAGENRLLELVARGEPLPSILDGICRLVEEVSAGSLCSILLLDPKGSRLWHGAAPSLPASYISAFDGRPIGPHTGPCGRAAFSGEPVVVCDIAADPLGDDYRALALAHGLQSCWSTPIRSSEGKALGTFAVLSREPRSPTPQHQKIIGQITHLAAVAIERKRAEDALRRSEAYLAEAERLNHTGSWAYDVVRRVPSYWSAERCRISGFDPARGLPPPAQERAIHPPEDWTRLMETVDRAIRERSDFQTDSRLVFSDGSVKHLHIVGHPVLNSAGEVVELVGSTMDVTATWQAGVLLAGEKRLLEMIAKGDLLATILTELCRLFEELCSGSLSSILLLDAETRQLRHGAAPSLPQGYIEAIDGGVIGPSAGSCGTAAYRGKPVIVPDIATDPLWDDYRDTALFHGLRACWSTPILSSESKVLGTFAIYYREARSPTSHQLAVIDRLTHVANIALERKRAEETLRRSEAYLAEAQKLSRTGSFGWRLSTGELVWSEETFRIMGCDRALKPTLELVLSRVHPDDVALVQQTIDRVAREGGGFDIQHRLLMPDGRVKYLHVMAHPARIESNEPEFVGAVMDITGKKESEEALRASEHLARGQLAALTRTLDLLARESDPDKLPKHVVTTILSQLDAHSAAIWERNGEVLDLLGIIEEGCFKSRSEVGYSGGSIPVAGLAPPLWVEALQTGTHMVIEDINKEPSRILLGDGRTAFWRREDLSTPFADLKTHLEARGVRGLLVSPMMLAGQLAGIVGIRFTGTRAFGLDEIELTKALAHQATLALELTRLSQQRRQSAVMEERNRMARDIHDTLAQGFTGVIVQLEAAADATSKKMSKEAREHLERAGDLARESLKEARRSVRALRPQALEELDLCEALDRLIRKLTAGTALGTEFNVRGQPAPLPPDWEDNLLRIGQEVLTNALRHSHATEFKAQLVFGPNEIRLELRDNGRGFDPAGRHDGFGLLGMKERVEAMGGQITIQSKIGEGTAIGIVLCWRSNP